MKFRVEIEKGKWKFPVYFSMWVSEEASLHFRKARQNIDPKLLSERFNKDKCDAKLES